MTVLFLLFLGLTIFAYFGYPLSLQLLSFIRNRGLPRKNITPSVSFVITVHNEEKKIRAKLENTLQLDYPRELLQIVVASDGSKDQTNHIVRQFAPQGVELLAVEKRMGKEYAQNHAIRNARGEIMVFTDVATILASDGLRKIVSGFADPTVGCISGEDRVVGAGGENGGEGLYVRYEMLLRSLESKVNTLVGLSGSFFAARKDVCRDFSTRHPSDFRILLSCVRQGLRGVSDPEAIGYYPDVGDPSREFSRKIRTIIRGLTVFFAHGEFLNVFRYGLFSYQYFCHKLLRWLVPFFMIGMVVVSAVGFLRGSEIDAFLFGSQLLFYALAVVGILVPRIGSSALFKIPKFLVIFNASVLVAWSAFLSGKRITVWTPSVRVEENASGG